MARFVYRANLQAQSFPWLSTDQGATVIVAGQDQAFVRSYQEKTLPDRDLNVPQIYYAQDVLPTIQGYQSVGFSQITAFSYSLSGLLQVIRVTLSDKTTGYLANTTSGVFLARSGGNWNSVISRKTNSAAYMTVAVCQGTTYVCIQGEGVYSLSTSDTLVSVTLTGLDYSNVHFLATYLGYLLVASASAFYWSSVVSPTDFTPSLATGAGGGNVESARGSITGIVSSTGGIYITCEENIVYAGYSNNDRYPFVLKEIPDTGGVDNLTQIASCELSDVVYLYTDSGLQSLSAAAGGTTLYPEATDFLQKGIHEYYDSTTKKLVQVKLTETAPLCVKVANVADRYVIISYGASIGAMVGALIYDTVLKKWGRVVCDHTNVVQNFSNNSIVDTVRGQVAFVSSLGQITILTPEQGTGIVLLGKFQYVRQKMIALNSCEFHSCPDVEVQAIVEYPNQTKLYFDLTEIRTNENTAQFGVCPSGRQISLLLKGKFSIESVVLDIQTTGDC